MSIKARSAIGLAGHGADLALWFVEERGRWTTSTAYAPAFDPAVREYVDSHPVTADYGKTWERSYETAATRAPTREKANGRPPAGRGCSRIR